MTNYYFYIYSIIVIHAELTLPLVYAYKIIVYAAIIWIICDKYFLIVS